MQIDIKQGRLPGGLKNHVRIPNFLKKRLRRHQNESCLQKLTSGYKD
jgi:hypothetical protein